MLPCGFGLIRSLEDLVFALINEIGLGIDQNGLLYDTDTNMILSLNGRQIKASVDINNPVIPNDMFVILDPVFDNKVMSFLFAYYLKKEEAEGELNPLSISEDFEPIPFYYKSDGIKTRKSRVGVVLLGGQTIYSQYYYQKGLKYSDLILRVKRKDIDLRMFDSLPEECISSVPIATNIYPKNDDMYY